MSREQEIRVWASDPGPPECVYKAPLQADLLWLLAELERERAARQEAERQRDLAKAALINAVGETGMSRDRESNEILAERVKELEEALARIYWIGAGSDQRIEEAIIAVLSPQQRLVFVATAGGETG